MTKKSEYEVTVLAAHRYDRVAPLAKSIKVETHTDDIAEACSDMADILRPLDLPHVVFVPVPSSSGKNLSTSIMADYLTEFFPNAELWEGLIRAIPVRSSMLLKMAKKKGLSVEEQAASLQVVHRPPAGDIVLVDNVCGTGNTLLGCAHALEQDVYGLVYARSIKGKGLASDEFKVRGNPGARPRLCVSGSRDYVNLHNVREYLELVPDDFIVVHGGARGVDQYAEKVCQELGLETEIHLPDWSQGPSAGPKRNRKMMATCDGLVAFWNGRSRGTASTLQFAEANDKPFEIVYDRDHSR